LKYTAIKNKKNGEILFTEDSNNRKVKFYTLKNVVIASESNYYPNLLFRTDTEIINPIEERIMSLQGVEKTREEKYKNYEFDDVVEENIFYFIYNVDNYYHFVYDTLPYLITFNELKKKGLCNKILINTSPVGKLYTFVSEFLELCGILKEDMVFCRNKTLYKNIYISDSYTHGHDSNVPPRQEIYQLYEELKNKVSKIVNISSYPKKIYISRRSWIHKNFSNIGTNYTQRRKLLIEDDLVRFLESEGFTEVFTENLSTHDKIGMMMGAEMVIGAIGGGLCNLLFANSECKSICICSPHFLSINSRFIFSFPNGITNYYLSCFNTESDRWKKWMRIKWNDRIGEIKEVYEDYLLVNSSIISLSGWNNEDIYEEIKVPKKEAIELDNGLNSEWTFDLDDFIKFYNRIK
jgi:hypothetical protein